MLCKTLLLTIAATVSLVAAQQTIDPNSVPAATRSSWCDSERNICPQLCNSDGTTSNTCDSTTLNYTCSCRSGSQPNVTDYQGTIPFFVCQTAIANCIAANTQSASAQLACRAVTCGNKTVSSASASTSSSSSSSAASTTSAASSTAAQSASTTAASTSASASASKAAAALNIAQSFATPALVAGMLAVFGLVA